MNGGLTPAGWVLMDMRGGGWLRRPGRGPLATALTTGNRLDLIPSDMMARILLTATGYINQFISPTYFTLKSYSPLNITLINSIQLFLYQNETTFFASLQIYFALITSNCKP